MRCHGALRERFYGCGRMCVLRCIIHHTPGHVPQPLHPSTRQTIINSRWISRRPSRDYKIVCIQRSQQQQQRKTLLQRIIQSHLFHHVLSQTRRLHVSAAENGLPFIYFWKIAVKCNCVAAYGICLQWIFTLCPCRPAYMCVCLSWTSGYYYIF